MGKLSIRDYDLTESFGDGCLIGELAGKQAQEIFLDIVNSEDPCSIWNIDLQKCACIDYNFLYHFFAEILENNRRILPDSVGIVISYYREYERTYIISGLTWDQQENHAIDEDISISIIKKLKRYTILADHTRKEEDCSFEYLGTDEIELLNLLSFLEKKESACVDNIRDELGWNSNQAVNRLEDLEQRGHIFKFAQNDESQNIETEYVSVGKLFKEKVIE